MDKPNIMFISGPISAETEEGIGANVKRAELAALECVGKGWYVLCTHSAYHWTRYITAKNRPSWKDWLNHDFGILQLATAVYSITLPDGSLSPGSKIEIEWAKEQNIPIYTDLNDIPIIPTVDVIGSDYEWSKEWA